MEKKCRCFIMHAKTEKEKKWVRDMIDYSRKVGDMMGTVMFLGMLGKCGTT